MSIEDYIAFFRTCIVCGKESRHVVGAAEYERWQGGELIQDVWPDLSLDDREMMMAGTHPRCWDAICPDDDDDHDDDHDDGEAQ